MRIQSLQLLIPLGQARTRSFQLRAPWGQARTKYFSSWYPGDWVLQNDWDWCIIDWVLGSGTGTLAIGTLRLSVHLRSYRKHSIAQRSQPAQAAKQVRADQSAQRKQASRQSWLEPACRRAFNTARFALTKEEIEICLRLTKNTRMIHTTIDKAGVMRQGSACTPLFLSVIAYFCLLYTSDAADE